MSTVVAPELAGARGSPVGDWKPARYTDTLTGDENFTTRADGLLAVVREHWRSPEGPIDLDEWQVWLLRRVLETYPPDWPVEHLRGRLRYKRVVISMARQNGKSVLGAILALFFLTRHVRGAKVGGFASRNEQAEIVYDRVRYAIENSPVLSSALRATATRGITLRDRTAIYETHPAKEDSLQGEPFTAAIYDELHLGNAGLWDAIILGQRSKLSAMLVGLTTAGDDDSLLLKRLYAEGAEALAGGAERVGFFVWESDTETFGLDYVPTEADVIAASPAIACGRIPLADVMDDTLTMWADGPDKDGVTGRDRVIRYVMNRFVEGAADTWTSSVLFNSLAGDVAPTDGSTVYGIQRTPDWEHAAIFAATSDDAGRVRAQLVATIADPDHDTLARACRDLAALGPSTFAMPADTLRPLAKTLKDDGYEAWALSLSEAQQALATMRGVMRAGRFTHDGHPLVRRQSGLAKTRKNEEGERLSRTLSSGAIDAVEAMFSAVFVASTAATTRQQLY